MDNNRRRETINCWDMVGNVDLDTFIHCLRKVESDLRNLGCDSFIVSIQPGGDGSMCAEMFVHGERNETDDERIEREAAEECRAQFDYLKKKKQLEALKKELGEK